RVECVVYGAGYLPTGQSVHRCSLSWTWLIPCLPDDRPEAALHEPLLLRYTRNTDRAYTLLSFPYRNFHRSAHPVARRRSNTQHPPLDSTARSHSVRMVCCSCLSYGV